jgi:segregation and condensation protein A
VSVSPAEPAPETPPGGTAGPATGPDPEPAGGRSADAPGPGGAGSPAGGFEVHLDVFEGPFDLLLQLISKHQLDVTEVALSKVTDEFIAHIRALGGSWPLDQASEFLVVAATLLDLKAARLLPSGEVEDDEDLALLEARDLLFARLLQYRAYKQAAAVFAGRIEGEARRFPRVVSLEPALAQLLPEVLLGLGPTEFATLAGRALAPKPAPVVSTSHLHIPTVSVQEQAIHVAGRLRRSGQATFRSLVGDVSSTVEVVARFLALLELYRDGYVAFEQLDALGELHVRWTGPADAAAAEDAVAAVAARAEAEFATGGGPVGETDRDPQPGAGDPVTPAATGPDSPSRDADAGTAEGRMDE